MKKSKTSSSYTTALSACLDLDIDRITACPPDPAMNAAHFNTDFTVKPPGVRSVPEGWSATNKGTFQTAPGEGLELIMKNEGDGPTLVSTNYFLFGHFEVVAKAAPGAGVVSAITFQSDNLDEIDFVSYSYRFYPAQT